MNNELSADRFIDAVDICNARQLGAELEKQGYDDIDELTLYFNIPDAYSHFLEYADAGQGIWTDGIQFGFVDYTREE